MAKAKDSVNRTFDSYPEGTTIYCWKFYHPTVGAVGGGKDDDWSPNRAEIESRMNHCGHPSKLIEKVAGHWEEDNG